MLNLYNTLSFIALILYFPFLLFKKGPENKATFLSERLGLASYAKTDIWVHAVSVGETLAALPFLKRLKREFPASKITLSTTTYTGQRIARDKFPEADRIMYIPVDTVVCLSRVVNRLKPGLFITVETELWPALFNSLQKAGARNIILNGRLSEGSFKGYKRIAFFMKKVLSKVDYLYMQGSGDAERIKKLGADKDKVGIMGNFKFDMEFSKQDCPEWLENIKGRKLLAGSTHRGEDEIILEAFKNIRKQNEDIKLIIVPRHPERFREVEDLIKQKKHSYQKRSEMSGADNKEVEVILMDTMGELSKVFAGIDIAFIGGSLVPVGGHNIMEPAYWEKPILFGPHMENFPIAGEFLNKDAAIEVRSAGDIQKAVITILEDSEKAIGLGKRARAIVDDNSGAVERAIKLLRSHIGAT